MIYYSKTMPSPVGEITLIADDKALVAILWENDDPNRVRLRGQIIEINDHPILQRTESQLKKYFAGELKNSSYRLILEELTFRIKYGMHSSLFLMVKRGPTNRLPSKLVTQLPRGLWVQLMAKILFQLLRRAIASLVPIKN